MIAYQSCNRTVRSSRYIVFERKSIPIVACTCQRNPTTALAEKSTCYGLLGYVNGSYPCPEDPIEGHSWRSQDALLRSLLITSLSEDILPMIISEKTSRDIWKTLAHAFSAPSESRLMSLHMALQNLKQADNESVSQFLQRAKTIVAELQAA